MESISHFHCETLSLTPKQGRGNPTSQCRTESHFQWDECIKSPLSNFLPRGEKGLTIYVSSLRSLRERVRVRGKLVSSLAQTRIIKGKNFSLILVFSLNPQVKYFCFGKTYIETKSHRERVKRKIVPKKEGSPSADGLPADSSYRFFPLFRILRILRVLTIRTMTAMIRLHRLQ